MAAPNAETLQGLREAMRHYKEVDNRLRELNTTVYALRRERDAVKENMVNIIQNPAFAAVQTLQTADGSATFKVVRPNEKYRPWAMSKIQLASYLNNVLGGVEGNRCFEQIVGLHKPTLLIDEHDIVRTDRE